MSLLSSSLLASSIRIKIIKKQKTDSKFYYDIYTRCPHTLSGTFNAGGYSVVEDITRKAIVKGIAKAEWYDGDLTADVYRNVRYDVNSSLENVTYDPSPLGTASRLALL